VELLTVEEVEAMQGQSLLLERNFRISEFQVGIALMAAGTMMISTFLIADSLSIKPVFSKDEVHPMAQHE